MREFMQQIPLSKGHFAVVDDADYPLVAQFKWCYDNGYAVRKVTISPGKYKKLLLHRFLLNAEHGQMVDHADGDGLNNQRCNLRLCNGSQNNANRRLLKPGVSKYKGVRKETHANTWNASIGYHSRRIHIGCFKTEEEAARAYDAKAIELYGEFAFTNSGVLHQGLEP